MAFAAQDYYLVKVWRIMDHGAFADMPSADSPDRLWWASDEKVLYRDTGSAWVRISSFDGHAYGNTIANRPTFGVVDRLFFATDEFILYRDTGLAWEAIGVGGDHHSRHENIGDDEINVAGLFGELADRQPVKLHAAQHISAGDDTIANVIAGGSAGLMDGADKTKLNSMDSGANVIADANLGYDKLIRGEDGSKKIHECSTINVDENGIMVNTGQPCFSVKPTNNQGPIAINDGTAIHFGTEIFDIGNNFATPFFTAPITGKYQFNVLLKVLNIDTAATTYSFNLITSNRQYEFLIDPNFAADLNHFPVTFSGFVDMDLNDTAFIQFYQNGGTQQTTIWVLSRFMGVLIC